MESVEQKILIERSRLVAEKLQEIMPDEATEGVVEFLLYPESYCIQSRYVREVLSLNELTLIPGTPPFVLGVINYHGNLLSVLNLKVLFGLEERGLTELNKVIIIHNNSMEFGIVADAINGNKNLLLTAVSEAPQTVSGIGKKLIKGITADGLILLDAEKMLTSDQLIVDQK